MYIKEVAEQEAKVQKMQEESKDEYDIKKQVATIDNVQYIQ